MFFWTGTGVADVRAPAVSLVGTETSGDDVTLTTVIRLPYADAGTVLDARSFSVTENGQPRSTAVALVPPDRLEVVLVTDTSEQLGAGGLAAARGAAVEFILGLPDGARISVVDAGTPPQVTVPLTSTVQQAVAGVGRQRASAGRALYDAVGTAARLPGGGGRARRVVVALAGGPDTASQKSVAAAAAELAAADAIFYGISLRYGDADDTAVGDLAAVSGGQLLVATAEEALVGLYDRVARDLGSLYELTYQSSARGPRRVSVALDTPLVQGEAAADIIGSQPWAAQPSAAPTETDAGRVEAANGGRGERNARQSDGEQVVAGADGSGDVLAEDNDAALIAALLVAIGISLPLVVVLRRRRLPASATGTPASEAAAGEVPVPATGFWGNGVDASPDVVGATSGEQVPPAGGRRVSAPDTRVVTLRSSDCRTLGEVAIRGAGPGGVAMSRGRLSQPQLSVEVDEDGALVAVGLHSTLAAVMDGHHSIDAAEAALDVTAEWAPLLIDRPVASPAAALGSLLAEAQDRVATRLSTVEAHRQDGPIAVTLALVTGGRCFVASTTGDTSAFLVRKRHRPVRLPQDRQVLGSDPVAPSVAGHKVLPGDRVVLASAGLRDFASLDDIVDTVKATRSGLPATTAQRLVDAAVDGGTSDNVTVVCLFV